MEAYEGTSAELLARYCDGDPRAADELFDRYMQRLTHLARSRLSARLATRTDPEDVVMSAWRSFFVAARSGRFSLERNGDLWRLLASITLHKLYRQARRHKAQKRTQAAEGPFDTKESQTAPLDRAAQPDEAAALADELEWLFAQLDDFGRRVLELRLQGEQHTDIARETGRSERTVRRELAKVRRILTRQMEPEGAVMLSVKGGTAHPPQAPELPKPNSAADSDPRAPLAYGDFRLERLIGAGRVGKVYRARQVSLGRMVAVKHLRKAFLKQPHVVERFVSEARLVAQLRHPGIVAIHGLGRSPAGGYFIVMDLVEGPDLARVVRSGLPEVAEAVRWIVAACDAIEHAHQHGIVHCDLKPGNLLLGPDGLVRVADFGLARSAVEPTDHERIEGTAPFMAPEQVPPCWGAIGPRTDIFGLGAVLYTLLTGQPPSNGLRLADILAQVVSAAPVVALQTIVPGLPTELCAACQRALSKRPQERSESARQFAQAVSRCRV